MIGRRGRAKNKYMYIFCKGKIHAARKLSTSAPPHFSHGSCLIDSFSLRKLTYARKLLFVWKKVLESFMKKENKHRTITREVFVLTSDANLRIHQPEKTTENSRRRHWFTFQREMKCHFAGKPLVASRSVGCFLGLIDLLSLYVLFSQWTSPGS